MPELPEVETVRRDLMRLTLGETIAWVKVLRDQTVESPSVSQFIASLIGSQVIDWQRRGKYLLGRLNSPQATQIILGVHLRMTGQLLWQDPTDPLPIHTRVCFGMTSGRELRFVDQRTFGRLWAVPIEIPLETMMKGLQKLGPEPFSAEFSADYFFEHLHRRHSPIKSVLLDQQLVAGVGNIYADESLFLSRIRPTILSHHLSRVQTNSLREQVIQVLQDSIEQRGTTFSAYRDASGVNGNYQGQAWVYGRRDQPCRVCGESIQRIRLAGRSAHFCPNCQPESLS